MKLFLYFTLWMAVCALLGWIGTVMLAINFYQSFAISGAALIVGNIISQKEDRRSGLFLRSDTLAQEPEEDPKE